MTDISSYHNAIAAIGTMPIVMFEVYGAASAAELAQSVGGSNTGEDRATKIKGTLIKLAISGVLIAVVCVYGKRKYDAKVAERGNNTKRTLTGAEIYQISNQLRSALSFYDNENNEV